MKRQKNLVIASAYMTIGILGIYLSLFELTLLSISQIYNLNSTMMGLFIAIQYAAISVPPLFLGPLSVRIGKKKVILLSYGLIIIGTMLVGVSNSVVWFMFSIFVIGAGFSVLEATHSAALADEYPEESQRHINFSQVCFSVGALGSPFIADFLIRSGVYFKYLYIYISVIFMIAGIAFLFVKYKNDKGVQQPKGSAFGVLGHLKHRPFLFLAAAIFIYVGIESTVATFTDSYYELALRQPQLSAIALSLYWGSMIPSRFLAGIVKIDPKKMLIISAAMVFVGALGAMLTADYTVKLILFSLCGFGCGPIWPLIMDQTAARFKGASAPSLNIMMSFGGLGGAVFPLLAGMMATYTNVKAAYYLSAVLALLMFGFYLGSIKERRNNLI